MNSRLIVFSFGDPGSINSEILTKALSIFEEKPHNAIIIGSLKSFKKFYNKNKELDLIEYFSEIDNKNKINTLSLLSNYRKKSFKIFIEKISYEILNILKNDFQDYSKKDRKSKIIFFDPFPKLDFSIGNIDIKNGFLAFLYLEISLRLIELLNFEASLITLPVNKKSISLFNKNFIGHTDYLIERFNIKNARMLMHSREISVLMETNHIPILRLKKNLRKEHFYNTLNIAEEAIKILKLQPYIYILGLNPHKSDNSLIGIDEDKWIIPTIKKYESLKINNKEKINIEGPLSSDSVFIEKSLNNRKHGLYIAWYHDQGLIPYKIISKNKGANITVGLPFIRISPDHGTGFDIVNQDKADPSSLIFCINTILSMEEK